MRLEGAWQVALFLASIAGLLPSAFSSTDIFKDTSLLLNEPVTQGNRIEFLIDGPEFYPVRLSMIRNAQSTIELQTFLWCDDEAGLSIARELAIAQRRGVRVRVIVDSANLIKSHSEVYGILEDAGIRPLIYNPPSWYGLDYEYSLNMHVHDKVMLVDGREVLVGGANLCDEYMIGKDVKLWHDLELFAAGPIADRIQHAFDLTWNRMADEHEQKIGHFSSADDFPLFPCSPRVFDEPGDSIAVFQPQPSNWIPETAYLILQNFVSMIDSAQDRIIFYTPYYNPPGDLAQALAAAAKRGVDVKLITNSVKTNDLFFASVFTASSTGHYPVLMDAGVEIHEVQLSTLHGKALLIDDVALSVGSHNFSIRSFFLEGESNILTNDQEAIAKFSAMASFDLRRSQRVTRRELSRRSDSPGDVVRSILGRWLRGAF